MTAATRLSEQAFLRLAETDPDGFWEFVDGMPRSKPPTSADHNFIAFELAFRLRLVIDPTHYELRVNASLVRWSERNSFIPDVAVLPRDHVAPQKGAGKLERNSESLPLVVEIWSPSTDGYDLDVKVAAHKARGDEEIWRIHPYDRTLTRWLRQDGDAYAEMTHRGGAVELHALPGVTIDLDALFGG